MATQWRGIFGLFSLILAVFASWCVTGFMHGRFLVNGLCLVPTCVLLFISVHLVLLNPPPTLPLRHLCIQYAMLNLTAHVAKKKFDEFSMKCQHVMETQQSVLKDILSMNKDTDYRRDKDFGDVSETDFRRKLPLTTSQDYEPYIERMIEGEEGCLLNEKVVFYGRTSGTTGKSKYFPIPETFHRINKERYHMLLIDLFRKVYGTDRMQRVCCLRFTPFVEQSKTGIPMGPLTAIYNEPSKKVNHSTTPTIAYDIKEERSALYVEAIFALADPYVSIIDGLFATLVYTFFKLMESHQDLICDSIERGLILLPKDISLPEDVHEQLSDQLKADPKRASFLRQEFAQGINGIGKRVWPNLKVLQNINTGVFATHAEILSSTFCAGVSQCSPGHGCTEGTIGVTTKVVTDGPQCYTLLIPLNFFEFIRASDVHLDQPDTLLAHELNKGECYELVLTTYAGLYRYRVGDVMKVVDFFHQSPMLEHQYRVGQMLSLHTEKVVESVFFEGLEKSLSLLRHAKLVDYTSCENIHFEISTGETTDMRFYVLFIELEGKKPLDQGEQLEFDESLKSVCQEYAIVRNNGAVSPMKVIQVKPGAFQKLKYFMTKETCNIQFKMPRVLRKPELLDVLIQERMG